MAPDKGAYEHVTRMEFPAVVRELEDILGAKLVAYMAKVTEARAVRQWSQGEREPRSDVPERLRTALHAALMIAGQRSPLAPQAKNGPKAAMRNG